MKKFVILVALFLGTAGLVSSHCIAQIMPPPGWLTYNAPDEQFSISYPPDWVVDPDYVDNGFGPGHEIHGVRFGIPAALAAGTNLSADLTGVVVERVTGLPSRLSACTASRFLPDAQHIRSEQKLGHAWSVADMDDSGAGHLRTFTAYALPGSWPCTAVITIVHRLEIGNFPPGTVQPYDAAALAATFDTVRSTLVLH